MAEAINKSYDYPKKNEMKWKLRPIMLVLFLYVVYMPLQTYLPLQFIETPGLNLINIFAFLFIFLWITTEGGSIQKTPLNLPIFFLFFLALLSLILNQSEYFVYDLGVFKRSFLAILLYYVVVCSIRDLRDAKILFVFILISASIVILVIARETLFMPNTQHFHADLRATGPFGFGAKGGHGANSAGAFLAQFTTLFIAAYFFYFTSIKYRIAVLFLSFFGVYSLLYTFSRGGYIAAFLSIAFVILMKSKKSLSIFIVIIMLTYSFWAPSSVLDRIESTRIENESGQVEFDATANIRTNIWKGTVEMIKDNPLGIGFNNFKREMVKYVPAELRGGARDAHNFYLTVAAEMGILGLLTFLWLLLTMYRSAWKFVRMPNEGFLKAISVGFFAILLAMSSANFFSSTFFMDQINGIFWVFAGVVMKANILMEEGIEKGILDDK